MGHIFGGGGGGGANAQLESQISKENAAQNKLLKQEQAQQETEAQQLEAQRIAALRGRFGADTSSSENPAITGTASQTSPMSTASLYSILTGRNLGA